MGAVEEMVCVGVTEGEYLLVSTLCKYDLRNRDSFVGQGYDE